MASRLGLHIGVGRQAVDLVGVVGGLFLKFALANATPEAAAFLRQSVDDGRIRLQTHAATYPVDEDAGNAIAFTRPTGFLLNDRCQNESFFLGFEREAGVGRRFQVASR